jgi:catechol 2,3-dioxygenase-like lactoylglutathione lyase family enzyme
MFANTKAYSGIAVSDLQEAREFYGETLGLRTSEEYGLMWLHLAGGRDTLVYGMPAYARDGKVVCFFQSAEKFKSRYATLGFSDKANLDEGAMWPTSFALKELTATEEARIVALVKKAVS